MKRKRRTWKMMAWALMNDCIPICKDGQYDVFPTKQRLLHAYPWMINYSGTCRIIRVTIIIPLQKKARRK